jgi:AraC-like DNA-binding protein
MTCGRIPSLIASAASIPSISTCPRRALDAIPDLNDVVRIDDLDCREPGIGVDDRIPPVRSDSPSSLRLPRRGAVIFVDHVTVAIAAHVLQNWPCAVARAGGGLAPELRAKEILDGEVAIAHLARECGVPFGDFARRFRESTEMAPYQWLLRARIDKNLLRRSSLSQTEVARACGFADEAHFSRVFARHDGTHPGACRRA